MCYGCYGVVQSFARPGENRNEFVQLGGIHIHFTKHAHLWFLVINLDELHLHTATLTINGADGLHVHGVVLRAPFW